MDFNPFNNNNNGNNNNFQIPAMDAGLFLEAAEAGDNNALAVLDAANAAVVNQQQDHNNSSSQRRDVVGANEDHNGHVEAVVFAWQSFLERQQQLETGGAVEVGSTGPGLFELAGALLDRLSMEYLCQQILMLCRQDPSRLPRDMLLCEFSTEPSGAQGFAQVMALLPLTSLSVASGSLEGHLVGLAWKRALLHCAKLKQLEFSSIYWDADSFQHFCGYVQEYTSPAVPPDALALAQQRAPSPPQDALSMPSPNLTVLSVLSVNACELDDPQVTMLSDSLTGGTLRLTYLDLEANSLTKASLGSLARILKRQDGLRYLLLNYNETLMENVGATPDDGGTGFQDFLLAILDHPSLDSLGLRSCSMNNAATALLFATLSCQDTNRNATTRFAQQFGPPTARGRLTSLNLLENPAITLSSGREWILLIPSLKALTNLHLPISLLDDEGNEVEHCPEARTLFRQSLHQNTSITHLTLGSLDRVSQHPLRPIHTPLPLWAQSVLNRNRLLSRLFQLEDDAHQVNHQEDENCILATALWPHLLRALICVPPDGSSVFWFLRKQAAFLQGTCGQKQNRRRSHPPSDVGGDSSSDGGGTSSDDGMSSYYGTVSEFNGSEYKTGSDFNGSEYNKGSSDDSASDGSGSDNKNGMV